MFLNYKNAPQFRRYLLLRVVFYFSKQCGVLFSGNKLLAVMFRSEIYERDPLYVVSMAARAGLRSAERAGRPLGLSQVKMEYKIQRKFRIKKILILRNQEAS